MRVSHGNRGSHRVTHERNFLLQFQFHFDTRKNNTKLKQQQKDDEDDEEDDDDDDDDDERIFIYIVY